MPKRPLWRRLGGRARRAAYRVVGAAEQLAPGRDALLPPAHLRFYYYRTADPKAFARACETARVEITTHGLRPDHRLLDIGSGIGNLAIGLIGYLTAGYDGVEIHPEAVAWCQKAITPGHPTFRFHRADVSSVAYNPGGPVAAASYRFPFADKSFDFIYLGSVFTHMLPEAFEHYVNEIARLLADDGVCVASCFLMNDETRAGMDRGDSFMSFAVRHASGLCRLHDEHVPEAAVALDETFVRRTYEKAGLAIRDVRRGRWWSGAADDQDVVTSFSAR